MRTPFQGIQPLGRRAQRSRRPPPLNLIALMDVFTILVFFFLVHSADVMPSTDRNLIELPESLANQSPRNTLTVTLTERTILLQGENLAAAGRGGVGVDARIRALREALQRLREQARGSPPIEEGAEREVTIMADKSIRFEVLHKVMLACTQAGYDRILLSVLQRSLRQG